MSSYQLFKRTRNIRSAAGQMKPDELWVKQTRETLLMQVKNSQPAKLEGQSFINKIVQIFVPVVSFKWMRAPVAISMAVITVLFGGSFFSVSASERALPGDFLYSIKLVTEQARIALVSEPDERVKLKTEFTKRRVDEMKQVLASPLPDKSDRVQQAAEALKRDMDTIKNQLAEVENSSTPDKAKEAAKLVDENSGAVISDLQESKNQLTAKERIKLSEAQAAASDTSVKAIEVLVKAHAEDSETVTEEELLLVLKTHSEKVTKTVSESTGLFAGAGTTTPDTPSTQSSTSTPALETGASSTPAAEMESQSNEEESSDEPQNQEQSESADTPTEEDPTNEDPQKQLDEAVKSLSEADKLAAEKNLDEAVEKVKDGTQKAFAAQKTVEEDAAKKEEEALKNQQETQVEPEQEPEANPKETTEEETQTEAESQELSTQESTSTEETDTEQFKTNP
ncbi:hypothetical protein GF391_03015 [Candidatus Uhrbacteria bacterium]|nr:hypothetical protein [Candidatus Uhrbacteria bacterium]